MANIMLRLDAAITLSRAGSYLVNCVSKLVTYDAEGPHRKLGGSGKRLDELRI